jgi:hypothetical protein
MVHGWSRVRELCGSVAVAFHGGEAVCCRAVAFLEE